jgi:hypothetical protein
LLDNGKGRRLSIKPGKLADVPVGATVTVRLAVDQSFVMFLRAEGGTMTGHLKAVDPDKGIVVLTFPKGARRRSRGEIADAGQGRAHPARRQGRQAHRPQDGR